MQDQTHFTPRLLYSSQQLDRILIEIDGNLTFLILGSLMTIVGGLGWGKWLTLRGTSPDVLNEKIKRLQEEANHFRGIVGQQRGEFKINSDYDVNTDDGLVSIANSITPGILDLLPKDVQTQVKGLLNSPDVVDLLHEIYKKHPNEVKQLLGGFLKTDSKSSVTNDQQQQQKEQQALEDLGAA